MEVAISGQKEMFCCVSEYISHTPLVSLWRMTICGVAE